MQAPPWKDGPGLVSAPSTIFTFWPLSGDTESSSVLFFSGKKPEVLEIPLRNVNLLLKKHASERPRIEPCVDYDLGCFS